MQPDEFRIPSDLVYEAQQIWCKSFEHPETALVRPDHEELLRQLRSGVTLPFSVEFPPEEGNTEELLRVSLIRTLAAIARRGHDVRVISDGGTVEDTLLQEVAERLTFPDTQESWRLTARIIQHLAQWVGRKQGGVIAYPWGTLVARGEGNLRMLGVPAARVHSPKPTVVHVSQNVFSGRSSSASEPAYVDEYITWTPQARLKKRAK